MYVSEVLLSRRRVLHLKHQLNYVSGFLLCLILKSFKELSVYKYDKKIYFVRHGESTGNASPSKVGPNPELTEHGEKQAQFVAGRFHDVSIDVILSSPLVRAMTTAEIISREIGAPIETEELVMEWKQPESMAGVLKSECPKMTEMVDDDFAVSGIFPGGESFSELKSRALAFMSMAEKRTENNMLIASHDVFLHMLATCILFGEQANHDDFKRVYERLKASNTGISIFTIDGENKWVILTWNDSSHI